MRLIRLSLVCLGIALSARSLSAATVSFLVAEVGLPPGRTVIESSAAWENALLDVLFDSGYVASNAPIARLSHFPPDTLPAEVQADLEDARLGGADFFILAVLDYQGGSESGPRRPREIHLRLFTLNPDRFVAEERYTARSGGSTAEEYTAIKTIIRSFLPHLRGR